MDKRELRQLIVQKWRTTAADDRRHINTELAQRLGVSYELVRQEHKKLEYDIVSLLGKEHVHDRAIELHRMKLRLKERIDYLQKLKSHKTEKVVKLQEHDTNGRLYTYTTILYIKPSVAELAKITKEQNKIEARLARLITLRPLDAMTMSTEELAKLDI